jgi:hypothetical protein
MFMGLLRQQLSVGILLVVGASSAWAQSGRIPETHGTALSGDPVALPDVLRGKVGVLVLGFSHGSRDTVTEWGRRLAAEYRASPAVLYYEMPVLEGVPRLIRGYVLKSIRSSVPEAMQTRFVPLMTDEAAWRSLVRYSKPNDAYVLLVDGDGTIRWQTEGVATDASFGLVKQQVEALRTQMTGRGSR